MYFSDSLLEQIKMRIPLSELVGRDIQLKQRRPNDWWGLSPFIQEKTPSFHVRDDEGYYHCFSSGEHGSHFTWIMRQDGVEFHEAVRRLADIAGVSLPSPDPESRQKEHKTADLHAVMEFACGYFQERLNSPEGSVARAYLEDRAIGAEARHHFRLGFADEERSLFLSAAEKAGIESVQLIEAGLLRKPEGHGDPYPLFRNRLMFPIFDPKGRVIAFGGRFLGDAKAARVGKYINSPETALFDKGRTLYNYPGAQVAARSGQAVLLVEGYTDVIALWQAGFAGSMAPLGTAVTEDQLTLAWRLSDRPCFCLDGDSAGLKAAARAAERSLPVLSPGKSLAFMLLPAGEDPDSLIQNSADRSEAARQIQRLIDQSIPLEDMLTRAQAEGLDLATPDHKARLEKNLDRLIALIADPTTRRHFGSAIKGKFWDLVRAQRTWTPKSARAGIGGGYSAGRHNSIVGQALGQKLRGKVKGMDRLIQLIILHVLLSQPRLALSLDEELAQFPFDADLDKFRIDLQIASADIYDEAAALSSDPTPADQTPTDRTPTDRTTGDVHMTQTLAQDMPPQETIIQKMRANGHQALLDQMEDESVQRLIPKALRRSQISKSLDGDHRMMNKPDSSDTFGPVDEYELTRQARDLVMRLLIGQRQRQLAEDAQRYARAPVNNGPESSDSADRAGKLNALKEQFDLAVVEADSITDLFD